MKAGALYCDGCYGGPEDTGGDFLTGMALAIHIELAHRAMATCSDCRSYRYCNIGSDGETWCVNDGQCADDAAE